MSRHLLIAAAGASALACLAANTDKGHALAPAEDPLAPAKETSPLDLDRKDGVLGSLPDGYRWATAEEAGAAGGFIVQEATGRRVASTADDLRGLLALLGEQTAETAKALTAAEDAAKDAENARAAADDAAKDAESARAELAKAKAKASKSKAAEAPPEPDDGLASAEVAPGRSVRKDGRLYGPGASIRLDPVEVSRLRVTGHLLAEDGLPALFGEGPKTFNDQTVG